MSDRKARSRRRLSDSPSLPRFCTGPLECYDFVAPNEYSERTIGLFAFLLRTSVGDINFSDIFNEVLELIQPGATIDFVTFLETKRTALPEIDASMEKCLMLNRLITAIQEDVPRFMAMIFEIQNDMKLQLRDNRVDQTINYPQDFRQREIDFNRRRDAQNMRRLFYYSPAEAKAPGLLHLQNRTTEQLSYLIDSKMRYDRQFQNTGLRELDTMFTQSFMIINQPHSGVNPVVIGDKIGPGIHKAKISVIIVSLLHDFMQTHPDMIELYDIEPVLCVLSKNNHLDGQPVQCSPSTDYYLDGPEKLIWKTCELKISPNERPRIVQYAELTEMIIKQTSSTDKHVRLTENLHALTFHISLRLNFNEHNIFNIYKIPLESLSFAISANNCQIPNLLTRVIIADIRQFAKPELTDVKIISDFVLRYFMHRTGVQPKHDVQEFLRSELTKAKDARRNDQSLEEIYMDFLVLFVNQIEFMGKHPVLSMFYADGLFLGPCDSDQAADIMNQPSDSAQSVAALRCNAINVDYQSASTTHSTISMKGPPCNVRVNVNNARRNKFQYCTFDPKNLMSDILKFVSTANTAGADRIQILSHLSVINNDKTYQSFTKYFHERLHQIYKPDPNYQFILNILNNIIEDSNGTPNNTTSNITPSNSLIQNGGLPSDEDVLRYVFSNQQILIKILRQFRQMQTAIQQQVPPTLSQPVNPNSYQFVPVPSENNTSRSSQQYSTQNEYVSMFESSPSSSNLRSNQVSPKSTNEDSDLWMHELLESENKQ